MTATFTTKRTCLHVCGARARPASASLLLFDVSTVYFETDAGEGFPDPGLGRNVVWNPRPRSDC
jgi:hypothetical protein